MPREAWEDKGSASCPQMFGVELAQGGRSLEILSGRSDILTGWGDWVSHVEMAGKNVLHKAMNRRKN